MKNQGIVFFSDWTAPCPLLVVALHSLKKFYNGKVHVLYGKNSPPFFANALKSNPLITCQEYTPDYSQSYWTRIGSHRCWNLKPIIHQQSPFDTTLIYDCDHIFVNQFDPSAFDWIEKYGLASFHHSKEHYGRKAIGRMAGRVKVIQETLKLPCNSEILLPANGGCVGSVKGTNLLGEWMGYIEKFGTCNDWSLGRLPDEFALSYTLTRNEIPMGNQKWSYSPYPDLSDLTPLPEILAIHFCNSSYRHGSWYQIEQSEALAEDYMGLKTNWEQYVKCNPAIEEARLKKIV